MFEAYLDESGCDDYSKVLVVGGYLIKSEHAREMGNIWQTVVDRVGVPYFHMVDCAHGAKHFAKVDPEVRIAMASCLITLVSTFAAVGVAVACPPRRHDSGAQHAKDNYTLALNLCCAQLAANAERLGGGELAVVIEAGHASAPLAVAALESQRENGTLGTLTYSFAGKSDNVLLQAADLLAWQFAKFTKDMAFERRSARKDFVRLFNSKPHFLFYTYLEKGKATVAPLFDVPVDDRSRQIIRDIFRGGDYMDESLKQWSEAPISDLIDDAGRPIPWSGPKSQ